MPSAMILNPRVEGVCALLASWFWILNVFIDQCFQECDEER